MKKLLNISLQDDKIIVILLRFIKLAVARTNSKTFSGYSIVLGIWKIDFQLNISKVKDIKVKFDEYGRA